MDCLFLAMAQPVPRSCEKAIDMAALEALWEPFAQAKVCVCACAP